MPCTAKDFLSEYGGSIEGWLYDGAVFVTECLLNAQGTLGVSTGGVEIGVYKGKYLSFLAAASSVPWAGLDVFLFDQRSEAQANIERVANRSSAPIKRRVQLVQANTRTLTPESFREVLGRAGIEHLSFASIDGDHSSDGVAHDLSIVEANLRPGGIVAMDDMFSSVSPAVSEGFFRHMCGGSKLRPIAFSDNKLFMTTVGFDEIYQIKLQIEMSKGGTLIADRWLDGSQWNRIRPFLGGIMLNL